MEALIQEESVSKRIVLSQDLRLPHDAVTQTLAILAMRGVGKTHTASVFAEELAKASLPFRVLDPTGAWWGLRASADGKGEGLPVTIIGGDHGDIPLEEGAGKIIAQLPVEDAPFLVLDLSLLSKSAMRRFVADFAEELYRKNRIPLHLLIDEADAFAPQKPRSDELRMLGAIDEIVRRGRIRGLGCTLVTQRSAVLNKDVLTQAEVLIALRTAHPRDRAPILEWMKVHATEEQLGAVEESLAKLPKGDAWVMSAGWLDLFRRVHIRERETFNSSATPEPGVRRMEPRKLAPVDLQRLQAQFAATIEKAKASDPKLLGRRVAELEAELRKARTAAPAPAPPKVERKKVEVPVVTDVQLKRLEALLAKAGEAGGVWDSALRALRQTIGAAREVASAARSIPQLTVTPLCREQVNGAAEEGELTAYAVGLLRTLAEREPMRPTAGQLAALSGRSARSSAFDASMAKLRKAGLITAQGNQILLTEAGRAAAGAVERSAPTSPEELRDAWLRVLPDYERDLLRVLGDAFPGPLTREELGERAGRSPASSMFDASLASLRRNGLIDGDRGSVRATAELFGGAA